MGTERIGEIDNEKERQQGNSIDRAMVLQDRQTDVRTKARRKHLTTLSASSLQRKTCGVSEILQGVIE